MYISCFSALALASRFPQVVGSDEINLLAEEIKVYDCNKDILPEISEVQAYWHNIGQLTDD